MVEQSLSGLLGGSYDCVDRIVLNAYFPHGARPGGFRVWWRALTDRTNPAKQPLDAMAGSFQSTQFALC